MDEISTLADIGDEAPLWFWRIVAVIFGGLIIWFGRRHLEKIDKILDDLVILTKIHEVEIGNIKKELRENKEAMKEMNDKLDNIKHKRGQ